MILSERHFYLIISAVFLAGFGCGCLACYLTGKLDDDSEYPGEEYQSKAGDEKPADMNDYTPRQTPDKTDYTRFSKEESEEESHRIKFNMDIPPYEISEPEYYEACDTDWEALTYIYFANDILVDDYGDVVDDVKSVVGPTAIDHLKTDDDIDVVYVKNEKLKQVYEIIYDTREYLC